MDSLEHWDFAETFSGEEIALLLIGFDPSVATAVERKKAQSALQKVENAFLHALGAQAGVPLDGSEKLGLRSRQLRVYTKHPPTLDKDFLLVDTSLKFVNQEFSRDDVAAWLKANALTSKYKFQRKELTPEERRRYVESLLMENGGNKAAVARQMEISAERVRQILGGKKEKKGRKPLATGSATPFDGLGERSKINRSQ